MHRSTHHEPDGAAAQLTAVVREDPDCQQSLDVLRDGWQCDTLIHGDLKWDNCLVFQGVAGDLQLRFVDWELADFGDSAWDVGGVFQSYWSTAVRSALASTETMPQRLAEFVEPSIEPMRPALREYWRAYSSARRLSVDSEPAYLDRCLRYGAARMMQTSNQRGRESFSQVIAAANDSRPLSAPLDDS